MKKWQMNLLIEFALCLLLTFCQGSSAFAEEDRTTDAVIATETDQDVFECLVAWAAYIECVLTHGIMAERFCERQHQAVKDCNWVLSDQ